MDYEEHFDQSVELRNAFWSTIGKIESDVLTHIINPAFMGGPAWPSLRQAFMKIDTPEGTIIASDGLSDPYSDFDENPDNQKYNGLGCEFYLECDELMPDMETMKTSWQFSVLYQAAQLAAGNPNIGGALDKYTFISTELYNCNVPDEFINADKRTGVLLNLKSEVVPATVELSLEPVKMVNVKLLTLQELEYITSNGAEGRVKIAGLIAKQGKTGRSSLERESVV